MARSRLDMSGSLVIRVGLPIGPSLNGRTGHWDWLRYRSERNFPITIVSDEYRSAVWANQLARRVLQLADSSAVGIRHVAATRVASRIELANHLLSLLDKPAGYSTETRRQRATPHLGHVELATVHNDALSSPLMSVLDSSTHVQPFRQPMHSSGVRSRSGVLRTSHSTKDAKRIKK